MRFHQTSPLPFPVAASLRLSNYIDMWSWYSMVDFMKPRRFIKSGFIKWPRFPPCFLHLPLLNFYTLRLTCTLKTEHPDENLCLKYIYLLPNVLKSMLKKSD